MRGAVVVDVDHGAAKRVVVGVGAVVHIEMRQCNHIIGVGGCGAAAAGANGDVVVGYVSGMSSSAATGSRRGG